MDVPWAPAWGYYEKVDHGRRDLYWLGPLPYYPRSGILFAEYGPRTHSSSVIQPTSINLPFILSKFTRNNALHHSYLNHVTHSPPSYWKLFDKSKNSNVPEQASPSEALKDLYRLALRVYGDGGHRHVLSTRTIHVSQAQPRPAASPSRGGSVEFPSPFMTQADHAHTSRDIHPLSIADSTTSLHTLNASTLIGEESSSIYYQQAEDIKTTIRDFAASVAAWNTPLDESQSSLNGVHFNPISVTKDDEPWKHQLLNVLNAYRDSVESNTALHSDTERLRDELEKSRSQVASLRKELRTTSSVSSEQISQLTESFEYERRCKEDANAQVSSLRTEIEHLTSQIKVYSQQVEEGRIREQMLQARYDTLSNTFQDLKAQLFEPEWVVKLRTELREEIAGLGAGLQRSISESRDCTISSAEEILGRLHNVSGGTHGPLSHISAELRHQKDEIAQLRERNSQLIASNELIISNSASAKEQLDTLVTSNRETNAALVSMTSTVEQQLPHLAQTVHQTGHAIKKELSDMDTKLHSHHAYSKDQLGHINQVLHGHFEVVSENHAHTTSAVAENKMLLQSLGEKVQEQVTSTAQTLAAIPTARPPSSENNNVTTIAVESLRAMVAESLADVRKAVDQAHVDIHKIAAQLISHTTQQQELIAKNIDTTNARIEQLDASIRDKTSSGEAGYDEIKALLATIQNSISVITAASWLEEALSSSKVSTQEEFSQIQSTLQSIVSQLEGLNSRKDEGISVYIAEVTTQLTEMNLKLAEIGSDVRAAATASDIAEEISTVKDAHAHEYKASLSASERIQASIVSLENYTKSAVDQINAALDEQQLRIVAIQGHAKQQSEDSKAISLNLSESISMLKAVESQTRASDSTVSTNVQSVMNTLQEIEASITTIGSVRAETETLRDSPVSAEVLERLETILGEHKDLLHSLPKAVADQSTESHKNVATRIEEVVASLAAIATSSEHSSKQVSELREAVVKLDAEMADSRTRADEGLSSSGTMLNALLKVTRSLETNLTELRDGITTLSSTANSSTGVNELDAAISELKTKTDDIAFVIRDAKDTLTGDVAHLRQQLETSNQSLVASIKNIDESMKTGVKPSDELAALQVLIEKQNSELTTVESHLSKAQSMWLGELKTQIEDLRGVILDTTLSEVLESLRLLAVSVSDIRGLVLEESKSLNASVDIMNSIDATVKCQSGQVDLLAGSREIYDKQYEATVALLERNHAVFKELHSTTESHFANSSDTVTSQHSTVIALLDKTMSSIETRIIEQHEKDSELLKVLIESQCTLEQQATTQTTELNTRLSNISQALSDLCQSVKEYAALSVTLQQDVKQIGSEHNNTSVSLEEQYRETVAVLNSGFDSLRQEIINNPEKINALLATIQSRISELHEVISTRQESLEQVVKSEAVVLHKEIEPLVRSHEDAQSRVSAERKEIGVQLLHLERIQRTIEALLTNHHCNGCSCPGYDSNISSPVKQKRALSQLGSDATGLSPQPYVEQSFDVPSPKDVGTQHEDSYGTRPYIVDFGGPSQENLAQPLSASQGGSPRERVSFPRPQSPPGSTRGHIRSTSGQPSSPSSGDAHHHHHDDHEREFSNPFELFARRSRKTSHKPSEDSEDSHESGQRPRVKSSTVGSGKSQRSSLLASALMSTVSDNPAPSTSRHRATSGGLHRLSSFFGGKHHHHDDSNGPKSQEDVKKAKGSTELEEQKEG